MLLLVGTLLLSIGFFSSCAAKHLNTTDPLYGTDVVKVKRTLGGFIALNEDAPSYDGYFYGKEYIQAFVLDKCQYQGKC